MTSALYTKSAATALRLLTKYGQAVTLSHSTPGTYDPATGSVSTVVTTQTGVAAELSYSAFELTNTLIQRGDKKLLLAASGITTPVVDDTVTVGTVVYTIKNVNTLAPAGVAVTHELQARV